MKSHLSTNRRHFLGAVTAVAGLASLATPSQAAEHAPSDKIILPPLGKRILHSVKLSMIDRKAGGKDLSVTDRLNMAKEAGFDGVDFDQAGEYTPEQARAAVQQTGVFVHNAINHAHWEKRLTSANEADREQGRKNLEHCIRVAHAAGGVGVLLVVGRASDGSVTETEDRAREEIKKALPLAAALGQPILIENVWNQMMYVHDGPPDQSPERFIKFIDSFKSPWVGLYYDIGNHWKYSQPREWIRALAHRCVKLDIKGFSRKKNSFVDITSPDDDVPWSEVRDALKEIGWSGWAAAEVKGGGVDRLKIVREQMGKALEG